MNIKNIIKDLSYTGYTKEIIRHEAIRIIEEQNKEISRLNNIIDELESYLEQQYLEWKDCETDVRFMAQEDKVILDKLKELKQEN